MDDCFLDFRGFLAFGFARVVLDWMVVVELDGDVGMGDKGGDSSSGVGGDCGSSPASISSVLLRFSACAFFDDCLSIFLAFRGFLAGGAWTGTTGDISSPLSSSSKSFNKSFISFLLPANCNQ